MILGRKFEQLNVARIILDTVWKKKRLSSNSTSISFLINFALIKKLFQTQLHIPREIT